MAATWSRSGLSLIMSRVRIQAMQSFNATQAPVIEAVRVPPSAWITSQSMLLCRSPSAGRSTTERRLRPISRWISTVRPLCLPAEASRRVRSWVARGSMPYSAVTQPRPWPLSRAGSRSSSVAVTNTWVSPNFTKHEPSAYLTTPRSSDTARSSSGCRRLGRISFSSDRNSGPVLEHGREKASALAAFATSFGLDAGVFDHLGPLHELDLDEAVELLGRAREGFETGCGDLRLYLGIVDDLAQFRVEARNDPGRRAGWQEERGP